MKSDILFCLFLVVSLSLNSCSRYRLLENEYNKVAYELKIQEAKNADLEENIAVLENQAYYERLPQKKSFQGYYCKYDFPEYSGELIGCDEKFLFTNFNNKCLIRLASLSIIDVNKIMRSIDLSIIENLFIVDVGNQFVVYAEADNESLNQIKKYYNDAYLICDFKNPDEKYLKPNIKIEGKKPSVVKAGKSTKSRSDKLVDGEIYFCQSGELTYKYLSNPNPGIYVQLAVVNNFDCTNFTGCNEISNIILTDYRGDKKLRYVILSELTNEVEQIKKCKGFDKISTVRY